MQSSDRQKSDVLSTLKKLWSIELIKTLILMGLVVVSVLCFQKVLVAALRTDYPLHTPVSSSMEPTLNIGDLLIVQGVVDSDDVDVGEIIIFRKPTSPDEFIVHRVIEKSQTQYGETYFITKGDNNFARDPWKVTENHIIGKVLWRIPFLGYIKIFLGTPVGIALTIILFVILIFLERT